MTAAAGGSPQKLAASGSAGGASTSARSAVTGGAGTIKSGSDPSMNSGGWQRPQPRDRSPPNPESASSRNADCTRPCQRSFAASLENEMTAHKPAPALNSRQAVE